MPFLTIKEGPKAGEALAFPSTSARVSIGRASTNDIVLDDSTVSRKHAILLKRDSEWYIQDAGSHNRVRVNNVQVASAMLEDGDQIRLGNVVAVFHRQEEGGWLGAAQRDGEMGMEVTQAISLEGETDGCSAASRSMNALLRLGGLAVSVRTLPALFDVLEDNLKRIVKVDRVIALLYEEDGAWRPYCPVDRDFAPDMSGLDIDPAILEQAHLDGPVAARKRTQEGGYIACVPVRTGRQRLGAIYCERRRSGQEFTDEDLKDLFYIAVSMGVTIQNLRLHQRMASRARSLLRQLADNFDMVGESKAMKEVYRFIHRVAPTEAGVFITGESGTGKEIVARAIHRNSRRGDGPLEVVNCAAVPPALMESELFGHVKGAFTGAVADRPGRFELANEGTLFLDEVGELPLDCQTKLLRVLEEKKVRCIGDTRDRRIDVRLMAATNHDPRKAMAEGKLRPDLFYRLDRLRVVMPPLREREGDVVLLAEHFRRKFSQQCKRSVEGFTPEALDLFQAYDWPGNVRELRNVVERMVILTDKNMLGPHLIPKSIKAAVQSGRGRLPTLRQVESQHIIRALEETDGNKKRAAELLGIDRSTLYAKIARYNVDARTARRPRNAARQGGGF
ncbi:MAG: sigma 54-interacting transcriptional regulator [Planctomycetes bacterium]|nr:sigma 54-interacting transcriptional regulator [Planctomycetota bacterium]